MMCLSLDAIVKVVQIFSYAAGAGAAVSAFLVYKSNSRRERARWAESLYARFFERPDLKKTREVLDSDKDDAKVVELVTKEGPEWTDYLNFFEFVAYLQDSKQLSEKDVAAMLGYYMECLKKHGCTANYIRDKTKGFDYLRDLLFET